MHNEPVTFDPAAKEIAQQVSLLVARLRASLRDRDLRRSARGTAA